MFVSKERHNYIHKVSEHWIVEKRNFSEYFFDFFSKMMFDEEKSSSNELFKKNVFLENGEIWKKLGQICLKIWELCNYFEKQKNFSCEKIEKKIY